MSEPITDYCYRCCKTTVNRLVKRVSGVEVLCAECGAQIDFLHDEEDESPYFDGDMEKDA